MPNSTDAPVLDTDWACPNCGDAGVLLDRPGSKDTCGNCLYVVGGENNDYRLRDFDLTYREARRLLAILGEQWAGPPGSVGTELRSVFKSPAALDGFLADVRDDAPDAATAESFAGLIDQVKTFDHVLTQAEQDEALLTAELGVDRGVNDWFELPGAGQVHVYTHEGSIYVNGERFDPIEPYVRGETDTSWHHIQTFHSSGDYALLVDGTFVAGNPACIPELREEESEKEATNDE